MASKKKKKKTAAKSPKQLRADAIADLKERVQGKDGTTQLLDFTDEAVLGHVRGVIPTGCLEIDRATGIGGWPQGRIVEIAGDESSGKSTLLGEACASIQRMGGVAMLYDAEKKLDLPYFRHIGVNVDELQLIEPAEDTTVEAGFFAINRALSHWIEKGHHATGIPLLIGWDGVGFSPAMAELAAMDKIEKATPATMEKALKGRLQPGTQAKALSQMLRVITQKIAKARACAIFINQYYEKIGSFGKGRGTPKSTKGGRGLKYMASMRLQLVRTERVKGPDGTSIGLIGFCRFDKNHLSMPRDSGSFAIVSPPFGAGYDDEWTLYNALKSAKFITASQGWSAFNTTSMPEPVRWQGGFLGMKQLFAGEGGAELRSSMLEIFHAYNPDAVDKPLPGDAVEGEGEDDDDDEEAA